jgi:hypothetical protein
MGSSPFSEDANERFPSPSQEETVFPVDVVGTELNLYCFL